MHDDPLAELFNTSNVVALAPRREPPASYTPPTYTEPCAKCGGSGNWRPGYPCFACKGKGRKTFATSPEQRARSAATAANRKAKSQEENLREFAAAKPVIWAWMDGSTFSFAVSLRDAVAKYGDLTENQEAAALRCIAKLEAARAERTARVETAPVVDAGRITEAFNTAQRNGLQSPKLRVGEFTFSLAKKYHGVLYVNTADGLYLGKIMNGKFYAGRDCTAEHSAAIVTAMENPLEAAVAHGRLTGNCSCCGRLLTDPESVARGIGPICASRFGW